MPGEERITVGRDHVEFVACRDTSRRAALCGRSIWRDRLFGAGVDEPAGASPARPDRVRHVGKFQRDD